MDASMGFQFDHEKTRRTRAGFPAPAEMNLGAMLALNSGGVPGVNRPEWG
jgi:hypothetical protein